MNPLTIAYIIILQSISNLLMFIIWIIIQIWYRVKKIGLLLSWIITPKMLSLYYEIRIICVRLLMFLILIFIIWRSLSRMELILVSLLWIIIISMESSPKLLSLIFHKAINNSISHCQPPNSHSHRTPKTAPKPSSSPKYTQS